MFLRLFSFLIATVAAASASTDQMACLTMTVFTDHICKEPMRVSKATIGTSPSDMCIPFDNPVVGKCSLNHQYCDIVNFAYHQTTYVGTSECDPKADGVQVLEQTLRNHYCYNDPKNKNSQGVVSVCEAGPCPSGSETHTDALEIRKLMAQRHLEAELHTW